jgi:exoribonuclease R
VAWSMITYNKSIGELLVRRPLREKTTVAGILKVQSEVGQPSEYRAVTQKVIDAGQLVEFKHSSLNLPLYSHASSPIRRFVDLVNQHALYDTLFNWGVESNKTLATTMDNLNNAVKRIARYHATV